jgi:hypothetical protein
MIQATNATRNAQQILHVGAHDFISSALILTAPPGSKTGGETIELAPNRLLVENLTQLPNYMPNSTPSDKYMRRYNVYNAAVTMKKA